MPQVSLGGVREAMGAGAGAGGGAYPFLSEERPALIRTLGVAEAQEAGLLVGDANR